MTQTPSRIELGAATVAVVALSIWVGGLVALGACAAPIVFKVVPAPLSGDAMGAVFRRFDGLAIGAAVVVSGCEAVRMWVREGSATTAERLRAASPPVSHQSAPSSPTASSSSRRKPKRFRP